MTHRVSSALCAPERAPAYTIRAQGDRCLSIDFGHEIDLQTGLVCLSVAELIRAKNLTGVTDVVPSYTSVALHYHPTEGPHFAPHNPYRAKQLVARLYAGESPGACAGYILHHARLRANGLSLKRAAVVTHDTQANDFRSHDVWYDSSSCRRAAHHFDGGSSNHRRLSKNSLCHEC